MRRILINCLLLASLASALPNGRNKRDFTFFKDLVQKMFPGRHEINIDFNPSTDEVPKESSKYKLFELPGYEDVLIKVPVEYFQANNGEVPVNLNAFGSTVGTKTPAHTFNALKNVNNLVSSGILNENHDQLLRGSFGPMFSNGTEQSAQSNEEDINNAALGNMEDPMYAEETEPMEIEGYKEPVDQITPYEKPQNEDFPTYSAQRDPETIEGNSDVPNCDEVRVDTGFLIPPDQYQVGPPSEIYPAPAFVNVFYPLPADQNAQNPGTTERNHHNHHKHPVHHHHSHHHSHRKPHHHKPHHHEHTKLNETSPTGNGSINNDEMEGSTPSSLKPEVTTTEDPINYRLQIVSRLTNTETFQGINTGQTSNYTGGNGNATTPVAANFGSNQYVYRNQDNLKMVTYENKLKPNNHSSPKEPSNNDVSPVTDSKDQEFGGKQNTSENVTAHQNMEISSTSTESVTIENRLIPERSRNIHVHHHHKPKHPRRHHRHHHHPSHRLYHTINSHPIHFYRPKSFGLYKNVDYDGNENSDVPNEMASKDNAPEEVALQRFEDDFMTNLKTNNDTDDNASDGPAVSNSADPKKGFGEKENTFPSESVNPNDSLHNPMSTDKGETEDRDDLLPNRLGNVQINHRSMHPSRHPHHHHRGHHINVIGSHRHYHHRPKYMQLPLLDSDSFKALMNANTLHTNKMTENSGSEGSASELHENKLKENEWKSNEEPHVKEKLNNNSAGNQNYAKGETMQWQGRNIDDNNSKNRGDIPDE